MGEGGVALVNLFRRLNPEEPQITAALLALLEHTDIQILNNLLAFANLAGPPFAEAQILYPVPGGPAGVGEIRSAGRRIRLAAIAPGEQPPDLPDDGVSTLLVGPAGRGDGGLAILSWGRLDRWLEQTAGQHDPESRTGFLLGQFRAYLPEVGITYFTGFEEELLTEAPGALRQLTEFYQVAAELFERLREANPHVFGLLRESRPEDLLSGYCYRDYTRPGQEAESFLRLALHLESAQLQIACWFVAGGPAHRRLQTALLEGSTSLADLRSLDPEPLVWLWSPGAEQQIPLSELEPGQVAGLDWQGYTAAILVSRPFAELAGEGLVGRVQAWTDALLDRLQPVLTGVVH